MKKKYIIEVDESEIIEYWHELVVKEIGYQEYCIKSCPNIKVKSYEERPHGEWIIVKDEKWGDNVKCPFCSKEVCGTDLNFCVKCGAKLVGSEKMNES